MDFCLWLDTSVALGIRISITQMTASHTQMGGLRAGEAQQGPDGPYSGDNLGSTDTPFGAAPRHGSVSVDPSSGINGHSTFGSGARTEQWYAQRPRCDGAFSCGCPPSAQFGSSPYGASYVPLDPSQLMAWQQQLEREQAQLAVALQCARVGYSSGSAEQSGRATPNHANGSCTGRADAGGLPNEMAAVG